MATQAKNNLFRKLGNHEPIGYPVDQAGTYTFNQGDLCWYDSTAHLLKALDSDAHAAFLAGVADISSDMVLYGNSQTLAVQHNYSALGPVRYGEIFLFNSTSGDTYYTGTAVYFGADAQTLTAVAATKIVGYVMLGEGQTSIAGGSGIQIPVLVVAQFPVQMV